MFNLLASPCYSVAMQLSNLTHIYQARRILTLNEQVNELFTNKIYIKQFKIIAQNLGPRKKYYSRSFQVSGWRFTYLCVIRTELLKIQTFYSTWHYNTTGSIRRSVVLYHVFECTMYMLVNDFRIIWDLVPSKAREQIEYLARKPFNDILTTCFTR